MPAIAVSGALLKWHRASVFVCVFLLIAGFVSPGFIIEQREWNARTLYTMYYNVWYQVFCQKGECVTTRLDYRLRDNDGNHGRVSIEVMWPIFATMSVLTAIGATVIDVIVWKVTTSLARQRVLELIEFVLLLLTSFLSLMVTIFYGYCIGLFKQNLDGSAAFFPPSTVAYGLASLILLVNLTIRQVINANRPQLDGQMETDSGYRVLQTAEVEARNQT